MRLLPTSGRGCVVNAANFVIFCVFFFCSSWKILYAMPTPKSRLVIAYEICKGLLLGPTIPLIPLFSFLPTINEPNAPPSAKSTHPFSRKSSLAFAVGLHSGPSLAWHCHLAATLMVTPNGSLQLPSTSPLSSYPCSLTNWACNGK